jgi:hypothetical protein
MLCHLLDRLRASITIGRDDEEPSLRWSIDDIDRDIRVFAREGFESFSEPLFLFISSLRGGEVHDTHSEEICELEYFYRLFLCDASCWCCHAHDGELVALREFEEIHSIYRIKQ